MGITVVEAYSVLEIESNATPDQIKTAYRKMALKTHPDKNTNDPDAKAKFQRVSEAYKRLTDPNANEDEDEELDVTEEEMFAMFNEMFGGMLGAMGGMFFHPGMMDPFGEFLDDDDEDDEDDDMYFGGGDEAENLAELLMAAGAMGGKQGDAAMRRMFGIPSDDDSPYGGEGAGKSRKKNGKGSTGSTKYYAEEYHEEYDSDDYDDLDGEDMSALLEAMMMMGVGGMGMGPSLGGGTGKGGRRGAGYPAPPCAQGMGLGGGPGGKSGNNKKKKNKKKNRDKGMKKEAGGDAVGLEEDRKPRPPPSASGFRAPAPAMPNAKLEVGCAVLLRQRHKGWVRYRGPVHYGEGEWVGVELEEKGTGKNNGTIKGFSYFKCPHNTGVMVRASELQPF